MKKEVASWFGQSITDKVVTGALACVAPAAGWASQVVSSSIVHQMLSMLAVVGFCALILLFYINRRMSLMNARLERSDDLHAVMGYIIRHRIQEQPRTPLNRSVSFPNHEDRQAYVLKTIQAHRAELREAISADHPALSMKDIDSLLEVFYGTEQN